jgi:outer membrane receptor protein involved in Fe transport
MFLFPSAGDGSYGNIKSTIVTLGNKNMLGDKSTYDCRLTYYSSSKKVTFDAFFQDSYEYQELPSTAWDFDLTINSELTEKLHLTTGAKYRSILSVENNLHLPTDGFGFFYNTTQTIDDDSHINSWAGFAQIDYQPFDKFKIIAGGRLEQRLDFTLKTIIADTLFGVPAEIIKENYEQHDIQFIPRFAAIYTISSNNIIKFLYGKAINTPSWFQVINGGVRKLDLSSQYIQSYELNYITTPIPELLINTSVFYNKMNDLIVRTIGVDSLGKFYDYISNAGEVETKGAELMIQIKPIENLDIAVSCTYQKSVDLNNKDITYNYSPNLLGNLKVSYGLTPRIHASLIANYVDKMESDWMENPDGTGNRIGNSVSAYYTLGANIRANDLFKRGIYAELHGTNLLNQDIMYPATTNNYTLFPKGSMGMGLQVLLTLGCKF